MLMVAIMVLAFVGTALAGGRLGALAELELRWSWLIPLALALQLLVTVVVPGADPTLLAAVHVASYALGGAFVLANLRVPGVPLITAGAALNVTAILANGGVMPADPAALARAGIDHGAGEFANSAAVHAPRLSLLGDVFAWPAPLPLANVFSIGDIVLVAGATWLLLAVCGTRWTRAGRPVPSDAKG